MAIGPSNRRAVCLSSLPYHKMNRQSTPFRFLLLTMGSLGGQCVWSTEMAFASPFLLHLGMSKSKMSIVFIAGPLSGLIVQPIIGIISDNNTSKWGRRRPLLVSACLFCALSMIQLGFARPLAGLFTTQEHSQANLTIIIAILAIFFIDFSINAVNALDRALLLDLVESNQQSIANAWSARLAGIGGIIGFLIGQADLTTLVPFSWFPSLSASVEGQLDSTEAQLRCVCILVVFLLITTHVVTVFAAKEKPCQSSPSASLGQSWWKLMTTSAIKAMADLVNTARNLSRPIWEIFRIQFFLWIAWFPVLFFSTSWVGAIARSNSPTMDSAAAMRLGSLAMLFHAILSILSTMILPQLLLRYNLRFPRRSQESLTALWSLSILSLSFVLLSTWVVERSNSTLGAMIIIALTGFAWALSTWAPYALLGIILQKEMSKQAFRGDMSLSTTADDGQGHYHSVEQDRGIGGEEGAPLMGREENLKVERDASDVGQLGGESDDETVSDLNLSSQERNLGRLDYNDAEAQVDEFVSDVPSQSGTVLGLHNISIVIPQFLTSALSTMSKSTNRESLGWALARCFFSDLENSHRYKSTVFSILETSPNLGTNEEANDGQESANHFGLVLQIGGLSAMMASFFAFRLARNHASILEG